jgi:hypothetical protein
MLSRVLKYILLTKGNNSCIMHCHNIFNKIFFKNDKNIDRNSRNASVFKKVSMCTIGLDCRLLWDYVLG